MRGRGSHLHALQNTHLAGDPSWYPYPVFVYSPPPSLSPSPPPHLPSCLPYTTSALSLLWDLRVRCKVLAQVRAVLGLPQATCVSATLSDAETIVGQDLPAHRGCAPCSPVMQLLFSRAPILPAVTFSKWKLDYLPRALGCPLRALLFVARESQMLMSHLSPLLNRGVGWERKQACRLRGGRFRLLGCEDEDEPPLAPSKAPRVAVRRWDWGWAETAIWRNGRGCCMSHRCPGTPGILLFLERLFDLGAYKSGAGTRASESAQILRL